MRLVFVVVIGLVITWALLRSFSGDRSDRPIEKILLRTGLMIFAVLSGILILALIVTG